MERKGTEGEHCSRKERKESMLFTKERTERKESTLFTKMKGEYVANEEPKGTERKEARREGRKGRKEGRILQVHELFQFDDSGSYKSIKLLAYASAVILLGAFPANLGNGNRGY